ncbi:alpha/Beta hydrolase fold-containing protein [Wolffia australiana]
MATTTMATAAGAAVILYYTLNRRLQINQTGVNESDDKGEEQQASSSSSRSKVSRRPAQAPATWLETISTLSETLRFTYSETLGKWPITDLAFGVNFLLKRQGNLPVANIYAGNESTRLLGTEICEELKYLLGLLTLCWHFSKKPFPLFLEAIGFSQDEVLLQEPKAGILKPAFTILIDKSTKCIILLIRGTHSIRDTLTAATGGTVPFHHTVLNEGGVCDLVLGYAHCGMVAAARWIAKHATPCLMKAAREHPEYQIKIVGHSLGAGTAALLTYILREHPEFSSVTCVAFAPAACLTWELAESGRDFITSIINGADLVPTFSAASVDDLRAEVTASAWLKDLRNQIERTRILSTVYRSATAIGSRLPSMAGARARVAGAGAILRPVSNGTQVVMKRARNAAQAAWTRPPLRLPSWSCMGPRRRSTVGPSINSSLNDKGDGPVVEASVITLETQSETLLVEESTTLIGGDQLTEAELWQQLEDELYRRQRATDQAEDVATVAAEEEPRRFFPPGRIMHIVPLLHEEPAPGEDDAEKSQNSGETEVGIFLTPRSLYGKLRLSQMMINDHYMPSYMRNMEALIEGFEREILDLT